MAIKNLENETNTKKTNLENEQRHVYKNNLVQLINYNTNIKVKLDTKKIPDHISKLESMIKSEEKNLKDELLTFPDKITNEKNNLNDNVFINYNKSQLLQKKSNLDIELKTLIDEKKSTTKTEKIKLDNQLLTDKSNLEKFYSEKKQNLPRILADNYTESIFNKLEIAQTRVERNIRLNGDTKEKEINDENTTNLLNINQQKETFDIPINNKNFER